MKPSKTGLIILIISLFVFNVSTQNENKEYIELKGRITDRSTRAALPYCNILVIGHNIATVSNSEGEYLLKVPKTLENVNVVVKYIGYKNYVVSVDNLISLNGNIALEQSAIQLPQIDVILIDADQVVKTMFDKIAINYPTQEMYMTAFYRESIRKARNYVSLSEAVVDIHKTGYYSLKDDAAKLYKARKQVDYTKLDTLVFKLMGGPYNNIYLDIIKYPEIVLTENMFGKFTFTFDKYEWMDDKLIYVIKFEHNPTRDEALFNGRLYIDANSVALKSAVFSLNLKNTEEAMKLFIKKKPLNAKVTPVQADYRVDYVEKDGKWYYAYSRIELGMKINWKKKLFNSTYYATVEMAVTDQTSENGSRAIKYKERLKSNVIISETAEGFSDTDFWGPLNVIEPEKPIETAIKKIQKQLESK